MDLRELKETIAVRELSFTERQGSTRNVKISIGKPEPFPDSEGYYCPFQISGAGSETIRYAAGVDAVQALQLVMVMIGTRLKFLATEIEGEFHWADDKEGGFGFPLFQQNSG